MANCRFSAATVTGWNCHCSRTDYEEDQVHDVSNDDCRGVVRSGQCRPGHGLHEIPVDGRRGRTEEHPAAAEAHSGAPQAAGPHVREEAVAAA